MRVLLLAVLCAVATAQGASAAKQPYKITKSTDPVCNALLGRPKDIQYIRPKMRKGNERWSEYAERCPAFLAKERWMPYPDREFDDYALYSVDVDNDGVTDIVLYRRYDKEHFTTYQSPKSREYRRQDGLEISEEFFKVDLTSCSMERVLAAYEKTRLLRFDGVTYIENVNPHDRGKARAIYRKQKGVGLQGSYQDDICRFEQK